MSENVWNGHEAAIQACVLPGGKMPERKTEGAIGYDTYARAIVAEDGRVDERDDRLRKTLFDFVSIPPEASLQEHIVPDPANPELWAYELRPGDHCLIGVGFATALPDSMLYWLTPRSGLSMKRLTLTNAPGTVDPDYRGEAGALLVNQSSESFLVQRHARIAQAVFAPIFLPEIVEVSTIDDLGQTERAGGGFGSTGTLG